MDTILKIFAFMMISSSVFGQTDHDFVYYNNETYKLYIEKNWNDLIPLAKEGIENGHDFYYMRMRLGIAYYELGKYIPAKKQFEKALDFYPISPDAKSYLYYCYLFLGRGQEGRAFYNINEENPKFFRSVYFEPGIKISDNQSRTRNMRYFFLGLNHEFGNRVSLFHGYQRLGADFVTILPDNNGPGPGGPITNEYKYTVLQNEYYAALSVIPAKGFYITPAYHIQDVNVEGYHGKNCVFSIQIAKWLGRIKLYGNYYMSRINQLSQHQYEGGIVYLPLGSTNMYLQTQVTVHTEQSQHKTILFNKLGIKLFPKTWIEGFGSYGSMLNYSELNGYIIYNQLDEIKSKLGFSINQYLGDHLLFFNYTHENKQEYNTGIPFIHHDFILGLNLTF